MRVHPDSPSRPLTQMRIATCGLASKACRAANNPAPPLPRIRISVLMTSIIGDGMVVRSCDGVADPIRRTDHLRQAPVGHYYTMLGLTRQSSYGRGLLTIIAHVI